MLPHIIYHSAVREVHARSARSCHRVKVYDEGRGHKIELHVEGWPCWSLFQQLPEIPQSSEAGAIQATSTSRIEKTIAWVVNQPIAGFSL
jgi:hypothetical protein